MRSVSADESLSWLFVRIGAATDKILRRVADDLGLSQARTARKGRVWWREAVSRADGVVVVAAEPHHGTEEKPGDPSVVAPRTCGALSLGRTPHGSGP